MKRKHVLSTAMALAIGSALPAGGALAGNGLALDGAGNVARDGFGGCVMSRYGDGAECPAAPAPEPATPVSEDPASIENMPVRKLAPLEQGEAPLKGIAYDGSGNVVRDRFGECVWSPYFQSENAECHPQPEPEPAPEPVATPEPEPAPAPAPEPEPQYETITLSADALFDFDKSVLRPEAERELDQLATDLDRVSDIRGIRITGHTDSVGTEAYNQSLSERRANAVRDYLVGQDVAADLITTRGMGESQPVADNDTAAGRQKNRRVEVEVDAEQRVR